MSFESGMRIGGWDVHTHLIPRSVGKAAEHGRFGMRIDSATLRICGHGVPLNPIGDRSKLIDRVQGDGLDGAVVSVPPPLFRPDLGATERRDYANLVNDGLLDACAHASGVLRPLAYLPGESPALATDIAGTLDSAWAGVVMGTQLGSLSYASPDFDPLWETLGRRKLALFVHPGSTPDARLDPFYLTNLLGNPVETTIAAANLVFAGVMHRFPSLNVILAHGGGCVAALCGRWQRGVTTRRPGIPELNLDPLRDVRRFYVDSLVHSAAYLAAISEIVGRDRILLGSDWPFPMGAPSAGHDIGHLDAELQRQFRKTNAETAFGSRLTS